MAFDQKTRNLLQRTVAACRRVLDREFTAQFQELYGIQPDGSLSPAAALDHLGDQEMEVARLLRERINHLEGDPAAEALTRTVAKPEHIARVIREQAFTVLNRLAALRLCEERGLVLECVRNRVNSEGFQLFMSSAGNALGETYEAYRVYLHCLFDELALDLGILFDRFSPLGLLFPRHDALMEVLQELNGSGKAAEREQMLPEKFAGIWQADETIGWIYQYYNDEAERKRMREESAAPRNSRELAVRNQFFTPRYVVEFLTDNTLGRIWYEMTLGDTMLREQCRYLVRRPNETFLKPGEAAPEQPKRDNPSQEDLLKQPVFIPHRPLKDPRTVLMLDPACGSMHFGLYAFDLFEVIYDEAWALEEKLGAPALSRSPGMKSLHDTYASKDAFLKDVPRLIVEHNLHGIDIDPRCAQIAGLSVWLRAQKAWQRLGLKPAERPAIKRSNIVCAEPMPGEKELLWEFVEREFPAAERGVCLRLLESIFDKMQLAGEAGSLLKIEEEIRSAIEDARGAWQKLASQQPELFTTTELNKISTAPELTGLEQVMSSLTPGPGTLTTDFWERIEERIYAALRDYAEQAENGGGFQRRLFAEDAARGFAFIDLCRKRYDVVVMNPPFGEYTNTTKSYAKSQYADSAEDIDAAFVDRGSSLLQNTGKLGVIANRTELFKGVLCGWRDRIFFKNGTIQALVDLGYGVLDGAVVEAAAYVVGKGTQPTSSGLFIRALDTEDKQARLASALGNTRNDARKHVFVQEAAFFRSLPGKRVAYWITPAFSRAFTTFPPLEGNHGYARQGLASADNFRFVRLSWETGPGQMRRFDETDRGSMGHEQIWVSFAKGGEYSPYFQDLHLVINWNRDGGELASFEGSVIRNPTFYFVEALTYSERTASGFSPRALPRGCVFDSKGPIVAAVKPDDLLPLLGFLMSRPSAMFLEFLVSAGDSAVSGTAARQYTQSIVGSVPVPVIDRADWKKIGKHTAQIWKIQCNKDREVETGRFFLLPSLIVSRHAPSLIHAAEAWTSRREAGDGEILQQSLSIENIVREAFKFDSETCSLIDNEFGTHVKTLPTKDVNEEDFTRLYLLSLENLINEVSADSGGSRAITKKSYFADRKLELLALHFEVNVDVLIEKRRRLKLVAAVDYFDAIAESMSYTLGVAFGRWDIRYATGEQAAPELPDPFAPLPVCPPGQLQNAQGLPARPEDVPAAYPLRNIPWDGILVDEPNHPLDIERRVREVIEIIWSGNATAQSAGGPTAEAIEHEACELLGVKSLRDYFLKPAGFFADHLKRYSKSRRQAPIYWPLSTASGSYTLWLYYHRLTPDTLYRCVQQFVNPKLAGVEKELIHLRSVLAANEGDAKVRKRLEELEDLRRELIELRTELELWAPKWKPNLNDGVLITAAPLWKLFRLPKWRKDLKACWMELERGDYDWAHLAYALWPDRVREKCKIDRSLAIAQSLEDLCEVIAPVKRAKKGKAKKPESEVELEIEL